MQADGQLPDIQLDMHTGRCGKFKLAFPGETATEHIASLHEVPTIIELFKSHNNTNLMKAGDIGQVRTRQIINAGRTSACCTILGFASVVLAAWRHQHSMPDTNGGTPCVGVDCSRGVKSWGSGFRLAVPH